MILGETVSLRAFVAQRDRPGAPAVAPAVAERLRAARAVFDAAAAGEAPVYGVNTGLGSKLGVPVPKSGIAAHQRRIVEGRAMAVGPPLPAETGRAMLLARLISAARGAGGMGPALFDHLLGRLARGDSPPVPGFGSIGASDLVQAASWALPLIDAPGAPDLQPGEALALISHNALTVAVSADALVRALLAHEALKRASVLSFAGYRANPGIFSAEIHALRPAPGQADAAAWFRARLAGTRYEPTRIQDALSYRTLAPVAGAVDRALSRAVSAWEAEANGTADSPAVVGGRLMSTPNFQTPALALALTGVAQALAMAGEGATERIARLLDPALSGLPRDLSPDDAAAAGFVPAQKTAAALLAEIRALAQPLPRPAPIAHGVEDMAPGTPLIARALCAQAEALSLLAGIEGRAGLQAQHLRPVAAAGPGLAGLLALAPFDPVAGDRPLGAEFERMAVLLSEAARGEWMTAGR